MKRINLDLQELNHDTTNKVQRRGISAMSIQTLVTPSPPTLPNCNNDLYNFDFNPESPTYLPLPPLYPSPTVNNRLNPTLPVTPTVNSNDVTFSEEFSRTESYSTVMYPTFVQKSYGTEKRYVNPPPQIITQNLQPNHASYKFDLSLHFEDKNNNPITNLVQTNYLRNDDKLQFKHLHVNGSFKHFQLNFKFTQMDLSTKLIKVISKPSRNCKQVIDRIQSSQLVAFFNRINSQTARTSYLSVNSNNQLCSDKFNWKPFLLQKTTTTYTDTEASSDEPVQCDVSYHLIDPDTGFKVNDVKLFKCVKLKVLDNYNDESAYITPLQKLIITVHNTNALENNLTMLSTKPFHPNNRCRYGINLNLDNVDLKLNPKVDETNLFTIVPIDTLQIPPLTANDWSKFNKYSLQIYKFDSITNSILISNFNPNYGLYLATTKLNCIPIDSNGTRDTPNCFKVELPKVFNYPTDVTLPLIVKDLNDNVYSTRYSIHTLTRWNCEGKVECKLVYE